MSNNPKEPLIGELIIDASELTFLVDLAPGARQGMRSARPGMAAAVEEIVANQIVNDDDIVPVSTFRKLVTIQEHIAMLDSKLPAARKLTEMMEETRAVLDDQRERLIRGIATIAEVQAKAFGDSTIVARYEKTRRYRSAIALKAARTRRRKQDALEAAAAAEAAAEAAAAAALPLPLPPAPVPAAAPAEPTARAVPAPVPAAQPTAPAVPAAASAEPTAPAPPASAPALAVAPPAATPAPAPAPAPAAASAAAAAASAAAAAAASAPAAEGERGFASESAAMRSATVRPETMHSAAVRSETMRSTSVRPKTGQSQVPVPRASPPAALEHPGREVLSHERGAGGRAQV